MFVFLFCLTHLGSTHSLLAVKQFGSCFLLLCPSPPSACVLLASLLLLPLCVCFWCFCLLCCSLVLLLCCASSFSCASLLCLLFCLVCCPPAPPLSLLLPSCAVAFRRRSPLLALAFPSCLDLDRAWSVLRCDFFTGTLMPA